MAVVWIITTGNSDFKLEKEDGFSHLRTEKNQQLKPCQKDFPRLIKGDDNLFYLPARAMGILYGDTWDTHKNYFRFPLLEEFLKFLKKPENEKKYPDRIIVVLTNQGKIFLEDSNDSRYNRSEDSPYWRDTSRLEVIFKNYFDREFGEGKVQFPFPLLEPETPKEGLDNWDSTLDLVQKEFKKWQISKDDTIIVSHQASTPAVSSAVQFVSLAKFGEKITFLIGNERDSTLTRFLEGSKYLKGIRIQEAKALLDSHDYSGVAALVKDYVKDDEETKILLNACIMWNFAKFEDFATQLKKLDKFQAVVEERTKSENWWWTAYEAAYLAVIRLDKRKDKDEVKDTVDALFHSFRAVEGVFTEWGIQQFKDHIHIKNDRPYLQTTILDDEHYFSRSKYKEKDGKQVPDNEIARLKHTLEDLKSRQKDTVFYGSTVYTLFREVRKDWKDRCKTINLFWDVNNGISEKRNKIFHQLRGLTENELFKIWEVDNFDSWKERIREFINCVSDETFEFLDKKGSDGRVASLMVKVHQELKDAIAQL